MCQVTEIPNTGVRTNLLTVMATKFRTDTATFP